MVVPRRDAFRASTSIVLRQFFIPHILWHLPLHHLQGANSRSPPRALLDFQLTGLLQNGHELHRSRHILLSAGLRKLIQVSVSDLSKAAIAANVLLFDRLLKYCGEVA